MAEASSRLPSASSTPKKAPGSGGKKSGAGTPLRTADARQLDLSGLNLNIPDVAVSASDEPPPKMTLARDKLLEEANNALQEKNQKKSISLVVIGKAASCPLKGRSHE